MGGDDSDTTTEAAPPTGAARRLLGLSPTAWVLVAMGAGVGIGYLFPGRGSATPGFDGGDLKIFSDVFIRAVKMIVAPILVATLVLGIAGHGSDLRSVGRLAGRAFVYFLASTTLALTLGIGAALVVRPGDDPGLRAALAAVNPSDVPDLAAPRTLLDHVREAIPVSVVDALATNNVLQIVVFSLVFGAALAGVRGRSKEAMLAFFEGLAETLFRLVGYVMWLLPTGVMGAMAVAVAQSGMGVLRPLLWLVATVYAGLAVYVFAVLLPVARVAGVPLGRFWRAFRAPVLIAFTTTSSDAALPLAMRRMEGLGCCAASPPSCCPPASRSTSRAPRSTSPWPRSSWRRPPTCRFRRRSCCCSSPRSRSPPRASPPCPARAS